MTSGAQFYRGLSNSGAVFIPPAIMEQLKKVDENEIQCLFGQNSEAKNDFKSILSQCEFPVELTAMR